MIKNYQVLSLCLIIIIASVTIVFDGHEGDSQQLVDIDLKRDVSVDLTKDKGTSSSSFRGTIDVNVTNNINSSDTESFSFPVTGYRNNTQATTSRKFISTNANANADANANAESNRVRGSTQTQTPVDNSRAHELSLSDNNSIHSVHTNSEGSDMDLSFSLDPNITQIPAWSTFPPSRFTNHILKNIPQYNLCAIRDCDDHIEFRSTTPNVICVPNLPSCNIMKRIFETSSVPFNVTIGFQYGNFISYQQAKQAACFGNSSPRGEMAIPSFEELLEMIDQQGSRGTANYRWRYDGTKPWDERKTVPVFRGTARLVEPAAIDLCLSNNPDIDYNLILRGFPKRFAAVDFSVDHPDLLDARFGDLEIDLTENCAKHNATNGLHKLFPVDPIPDEQYFGDYQVALALFSGVSPAFEVSRHFMVGTAVILQEFDYVEWFVPYLKAYVHYIPLSKDLHDLEEVLLWVKGHGEEVKIIAANGRSFYEEYLTFDSHEEHLYELVYRLTEYSNFMSTTSEHCLRQEDGIFSSLIQEERRFNKTFSNLVTEESNAIKPVASAFLPQYWTPNQRADGILNGNMSGIPFWSTMPRSIFTDHVLENIQLLNISGYRSCHDPIEFTIQSPKSIPNISCVDDDRPWCRFLKYFFKSRAVPYNVSIGFDYSDFSTQLDLDKASCLGSSAPNGKLCMPNMEEVTRMVEGKDAWGSSDFEWQYDPTKPWEERSSLPIFRGTAWIFGSSSRELCHFNPNLTYPEILREFPKRFALVDFSVDHPGLLDARFSGFDNDMNPCMRNNATNGLHKLLPANEISPYDYFSNYQVAVVLPGIGAAFRLNRHFMTGTAVIFQDFEFMEWYTPHLKPFLHYIPLAEDLHDLKERLVWVKNHPDEVKTIAENGRAFYEKYLTLYKHTEHIYEFVYRLAEYTEYRGTSLVIEDASNGVVNDCEDPDVALPRGENMTGIPLWSKLPRSRFTDHLLDNIQRYKIGGSGRCDDSIQFLVQAPYNSCKPRISCKRGMPWCNIMKLIFEARTVPFNVSTGFRVGNFMDFGKNTANTCFGNSSPYGKLSIPNIEELLEMIDQQGSRGTANYRWRYDGTKPWDERNTVPVFRGTAWLVEPAAIDLCLANNPDLDYSLILRGFPKRFAAVDFSVDHPDLLDARFGDLEIDLTENCAKNNATNGLHKLFPVDPIPDEQYFGDYQVALALFSGVSPAFEVSRHFMVGTAVILQEFDYVEWFVPYLKAYVHYIPLSKDLHDLEEVLLWVKGHGDEVKVIAENGRSFYEEYLTFDSHEEHLYELVYRLAEYENYLETGMTEET